MRLMRLENCVYDIRMYRYYACRSFVLGAVVVINQSATRMLQLVAQ